ncbi:MAG: hypothetical protein ABI954_02900 [Pyrinomonadaceae bacterium]
MNKLVLAFSLSILIAGAANTKALAQQQPQPAASPQPSPQTAQQPQFDQWTEEFTGDKLDETKWEKFTFEGASGGKLEVKDGEVRIRSSNKTRAGIRSKQTFSGDKFIAEAHLAKVGDAYPDPGANSSTLGFGAVTILFDGSGRNRIEWILTSEGTFEAWVTRDGQGERLDNKKLGTKMKNPVLAVARVGDVFKFIINSADGKPEDAQVGLQTTIKNMPKTFTLMLYGYGSSENNWDWARVVVAK